MPIVLPVSGEENSSDAPVQVKALSITESYFSVSPVQVAVVPPPAAVFPTPIANPEEGMSRFTEGSAEMLESLSYSVSFASPVARQTPILHRIIPAPKVTTMSPVAPLGTRAIACPAIFVLKLSFALCSTILAVTPPIVTPVIVVIAPAFRDKIPTIIYRSDAGSPRF